MLNRENHRTYMFQIIRDIFSHPSLQKLAFKGGTLCYFVHGLDRFSTDIDIDCIDGKLSDDSKNIIENILSKYGTIKDRKIFTDMQRYIFSYGQSDLNIKIEINNRIWKNNQYEVVNFFGLAVDAMDKSSIFANKLVALSDRPNPASRDIRDINFFFKKNFPINEKVIYERTQKPMYTFLSDTLHFIKERFNSSNIVDANLGIVLDEKQKAWARMHLIPEVLNNIEFLKFNQTK